MSLTSLVPALLLAILPLGDLTPEESGAIPSPTQSDSPNDLHFHCGAVRLYKDPTPGAGDPGTYWYFTYEVTNPASEEVLWAPRFDLVDDSGVLRGAGSNVPARVTDALRAKLTPVQDHLAPRVEPPLDQFQALGTLGSGKLHTRTGFVVFAAPPLEGHELTLFVRGLSTVREKVVDPITRQEVSTYRTLARRYAVPGNALDRGEEALPYLGEDWIMR